MIQRKPIRLRDWDYGSVGVYFITICAKERKHLFGSVVGGGVLDAPRVVLSPVGRILYEQIGKLDAHCADVAVEHFVIMPNHVHFMLRVEQGPSRTPAPTNRANQTIPYVIATMKRFCNRKCDGQLFQRGYYDHIVRDQADYDRIRTYMDENPAKWTEDIYFTE